MKTTDHIFYAYRCKGCNRIVTKLQVLDMMNGKTGRLCSCGGNSISPCDIAGFEWFLPRVWKLVAYKLVGKLAPPPEESRPVAVQPMERPNDSA